MDVMLKINTTHFCSHSKTVKQFLRFMKAENCFFSFSPPLLSPFFLLLPFPSSLPPPFLLRCLFSRWFYLSWGFREKNKKYVNGFDELTFSFVCVESFRHNLLFCSMPVLFLVSFVLSREVKFLVTLLNVLIEWRKRSSKLTNRDDS